MEQDIVTPKTRNCTKCGADAHTIDWDYNDRWQVMCDNNHTATGKFNTKHRSICKWNNAQDKLEGL